MFEPGQEELLQYFLSTMLSKDLLLELVKGRGGAIRDSTYLKMALHLKNERSLMLDVNECRDFARRRWQGVDEDRVIADLKSGLLAGHNWHGAMPSMLHRSFQEKVREYCAGDMTLQQYLEVGCNIAKQEAFIVLIHDLCESRIIRAIQHVIPTLRNRSVSDFIFEGIPYDLKVTSMSMNWTFDTAVADPKGYAESLYQGADTERLRKQAMDSTNNWGINRFYLSTRSSDLWLEDPKALLDELIKKCVQINKPIACEVAGLNFLCQVVFLG